MTPATRRLHRCTDPQCSDPSQLAQIDTKGYGFASNTQGCTMRALVRGFIGTPGSFLLDHNPAEVSAVCIGKSKPEIRVLSPNV
jgi:hypothetical protein